EDPGGARSECGPRRLGLLRGDSRVVSNHPGVGKGSPSLRLEPLRAPSEKLEPAAAAAPTEARCRDPQSAEPAGEGAGLAVVEERQAAACAAANGPAFGAAERAGEAQPVEEKENGPSAAERFPRGVAELRREACLRGLVGAKRHALDARPWT